MTLNEQIETAFDFRGHVTIKLKNGQTVEGYLFNRQFTDPKLKEDNYIEVMLKGSADKVKYSISEVLAVEKTGEDFAAGNSYEDYLKKKADKPK